MKPISILFVCLGNICRSPMAETIFCKLVQDQNLTDRFEIDSAGLIGFHQGELADSRMRSFAQKRGYEITHRSRPIHHTDFNRFDLIVCMDQQNRAGLLRIAHTEAHRQKIHYMTDFSTSYFGQEVPDPYYGGDQGFNRVIDMLEEACEGLLKRYPNGYEVDED